MTKFILAAHGELAQEWKNTLELLIGKRDDLFCFCMTADKSGSMAEQEIREMIADASEHEYIVFTDVLGGSVNNIFTELLMAGERFQLLTGMNMPLLIGILTAYDGGSGMTLESFAEEARNGIIHMNSFILGREEEDDCTISY